MTKDEIELEFNKFFEFDTDNRSEVTSVSCKLFAEHIARKAYLAGVGSGISATRNACIKALEGNEQFYCRDTILRATGQK